MKLRKPSDSVGWLNSVGPLATSPTVTHPEDKLRELAVQAQELVARPTQQSCSMIDWIADADKLLRDLVKAIESRPLVSPGRPWELDD